MLDVKDFMTKEPVTVEKDKTISYVTKKMADNSISSIVVVDKETPVGIITEKDLVRKVLLLDKKPADLKAEDIMSSPILSVKPGEKLSDAVKLMKQKKIRRLLVTDNKMLVGIISETDMLGAINKFKDRLDSKLDKGKISPENHSKVAEHIKSIRQIYEIIDTGSAELNKILNGGFPLGSNILLEGAPGSGKSLIAYSYLAKGLEAGNTSIYVYANETFDNIVKSFESIGVDITPYIQKGLLHLISVVSKEPKKVTGVKTCKFDDLFTISEMIEELVKRKKGDTRCVINFISQSLRFWDSKTSYRFIFDLSESLKEKKVTTLYLLEQGMHDKKDVVAIEQLMDGIIDLIEKEVVSEVDKYISIKKMEGGNIIKQKYFGFEFDDNCRLILKK